MVWSDFEEQGSKIHFLALIQTIGPSVNKYYLNYKIIHWDIYFPVGVSAAHIPPPPSPITPSSTPNRIRIQKEW